MKGAKTLLIAGTVASVGLASIVATGVVSAESSTDSNIVTKIAKKLNLKESDVKAVLDEDRSQHEADRSAEISSRLQKLVDDGKITADQKKLIEAKIAEQQKAHEAERTALEKWATDNKIDAKYIMGGPRGGKDGDSSDRLQKLVDDGKINADQKKLIEDKQAELQKQRDADKAALDEWAKANNISTDYLPMGGGMMRPGGHGMGMRQE